MAAVSLFQRLTAPGTVAAAVSRLVVGCLLIVRGPAMAEPTITMVYPEEPGIDQGPGRFAFDFLRAAEMVVADSGLDVSWVAEPVPRFMHDLEAGGKSLCVGGAGITPQRAATGQFSHAFVNDRLLAIVALAKFADVLAQSRDFAGLISQGQQRFIGLQGSNYGASVAPMLDRLGGRIAFTPRNTEQMLDMLAGGRADFGLVMKTYTANYLATRPDRDKFVLIGYPDLRRDFKTAFYCSRAVPAEVVARLNGAIDRQLPRIATLFPEMRLDAN